MTAVRLVGVLLGALFTGLQLCSAPAGAAARYYINYDKGNDAADGLAPDRAWRHAPGDANARGRPAGLVLGPGDTLMFAAGVRYRGEFKLTGGGEAGRPLVITSSPGTGQAIIDGSDPVPNVHPCRSAAECGGSPIWQHLVRADLDAPLPKNAGLFTESGLLFPAQSPAPSDPLNSDQASEYLSGDSKDLTQGVARLPAALARNLAEAGEKRVVLELYANEIAVRNITALDGSVARFDPQGLHFNTDRPDHFAVLGHPMLVQRPGDYGLLAGGTSLVAYLPPGDRTISLALGRGGINLGGRSFVQIRNVTFEHMSANESGSFTGVAVYNTSRATDITIDHNRFQNSRMYNGAGPLATNYITRLNITDNEINNIEFGSGMRLYKDVDLRIEGNRISRLGRTGIMVIDVEHGSIKGNMISDLRGIHGNGLSAYLGNHDMRVVGNTITASLRPATFRSEQGVENDLVFEGNLIKGTADSVGALSSWGGTNGVTVRGNVLLGGSTGLALSDSDTRIVVQNSIISGQLIVKHRPYMAPGSPGFIPAAWVVSGNTQISFDTGGKHRPGASGLKGAIEDALSGGGSGRWRQLCELLYPKPADSLGGAKPIGAKLDCAMAPPKP